MTTIGYGDIVVDPRRTSEVATMIVTEVVATTIFAYMVGALIGIIINLDPAAKLRRQQLQFLNEYLNDMRCTFAFRRSLRLNLLQRQKVPPPSTICLHQGVTLF